MTGDQVNTALNISKNCAIIGEDSSLIIMNSHDKAVIQKQIEQISAHPKPETISVIMTGYVLSTILNTAGCKDFFKSLVKVHSVVCCRVTPKQKVYIPAVF